MSEAYIGGSLVVDRMHSVLDELSSKMQLPNPAYEKFVRGYSKWRGTPPTKTYFPKTIVSKSLCAVPLHALGLVYIELEDKRSDGEPIAAGITVSMRPHQAEALQAIRDNNYVGTIIFPCGGGKTTAAMAVIGQAQVTTLVVVHTKDLQKQWVERIGQQMTGVTVTKYGGGKKDISGDIVVATVQTMARMEFGDIEKLTSRFGMVIVDEAHRAPASTFTSVLMAVPARKRIGLTATPDRKDKLTNLMYWVIGPKVYQTDHQAMFDSGSTVPPKVVMTPSKFMIPPSIHAVYVGSGDDWVQHSTGHELRDARALASLLNGVEREDDSWNGVLAACSNDSTRTAECVRICEALANDDRTVLALSDRIEHIQTITRMLVERGINAVELHGAVKQSEREAIIEKANRKELQVVVGSTVADEGLDIKALDAGVLLLPTANKRKLEQRIGRVMRTAAGKRIPLWVHIYDYGLENVTASAVKTYKSVGVQEIQWKK